MLETISVMPEFLGGFALTKLESALLDALTMACRHRDTEAAQQIFHTWGRLAVTLRRPFQG